MVCGPYWPGGPRSTKWFPSSAPPPPGPWLTVEASSPLHGVSPGRWVVRLTALPAPLLSLSPSLGLTILEVACNMELPRGGEGWQRLRQGYLPPEFTAGESGGEGWGAVCRWEDRLCGSGRLWWQGAGRRKAPSLTWPCLGTGLSSELRSVLVTMLEPDPNLRATAEALLALPVLRQPRPWSVLWFMAAEALSRGWALWQVSGEGDRPPGSAPRPGPARPPLSPCPCRPCSPCSAGSGTGWLTPPAGCSPRVRRPPHPGRRPAAFSWTAASPAPGATTA